LEERALQRPGVPPERLQSDERGQERINPTSSAASRSAAKDSSDSTAQQKAAGFKLAEPASAMKRRPSPFHEGMELARDELEQDPFFTTRAEG
jgi:hypothetical protein